MGTKGLRLPFTDIIAIVVHNKFFKILHFFGFPKSPTIIYLYTNFEKPTVIILPKVFIRDVVTIS